MKDLHDAILDALLAARESMSNQRYQQPRIGMEDSCAKVDAAIEAVRGYRAGRPWRATEDIPDFQAFLNWLTEVNAYPATMDRYSVACAVADAMCPPPSPLANVLYDLIDDCFERGRTPTPEEIEPLLRPKVKGLDFRLDKGERQIYRAHCPLGAFEISRDEDGPWTWAYWPHDENATDDPKYPDNGEADGLDACIAAAQSHWEARAMEFYRDAFE